MRLSFIRSLVCGRYFICIISFNFLNRHCNPGNCGLVGFNNLSDVMSLLGCSGGAWTGSAEYQALIITLLLSLREPGLLFSMVTLWSAYWSGNRGKGNFSNSPQIIKKVRVNTRAQQEHRMPFLYDEHANHTQDLEISESLCFRRNVQLCHHSWKDCPPLNQNGASLLLLMCFPSFVLCSLTDICYHAKQVFLCKRTCPVCVSPSSLLRTQMSSVIKNPVNFWKETDGYPTRT